MVLYPKGLKIFSPFFIWKTGRIPFLKKKREVPEKSSTGFEKSYG